MDESIKIYSDLRILIPMSAMFVIIFGIVMRSLKEMPLFAGAGKVVIALCVSALAMYGMDQAIIKTIVVQYTTMGMVMLLIFAGLLLAAWVGIAAKARKELRRSQRQDDEEPEDDR